MLIININFTLYIITMLYVLEILVWIFIVYSLIKSLLRKTASPNYSNKTVWITGASSGIGEYLAY